MLNHCRKGFTLIELMIVIAIVGILTVIAVGSYAEHVKKAKRTDGQVGLLNLAADMERYYTQNNSYLNATLTDVGSNPTTPEGYYNLSIVSATATTFDIQAAPTFADSGCNVLTYNQLGQKGVSGPDGVSECW